MAVRNRRNLRSYAFAPLIVLLLVAALAPATPYGPSPSTSQSQSSQPAAFRLVRSVSGTKSMEQGGQFIIEDPRTTFSTSTDHEITVYFEWDGPPGPHHFEGRWRDPSGKVAVISSFDYTARQHIFGVYFKLALAKDTPTGLWALEVTIDGQPAGTHIIELQSSSIGTAAKPARRYLSPAEIYKLAVNATVSIKKSDEEGKPLATSSGFYVKPDVILTSFDAIDGASSLSALTADGKTFPLNRVLAWNRLEDWAILGAPKTGASPLSFAPKSSWAVGDDYFSLAVSPMGDRTIVQGSLNGLDDFPDVGKRLHLSFSASPEASGAPILNDYGEVYGIMTDGSLAPGVWSLRTNLHFGFPANLANAGPLTTLQNVLAVPIDVVQFPPSEAGSHSLQELWSSGQFIAPLVGSQNISMGTLTLGPGRGPTDFAIGDTKFQYSKTGGPFTLFLNWQVQEKIKGRISIRFYNLANALVSQSPAKKISFSRGENVNSRWKIDPSGFSPGLYRVDVILDGTPLWRTYFRITP